MKNINKIVCCTILALGVLAASSFGGYYFDAIFSNGTKGDTTGTVPSGAEVELDTMVYSGTAYAHSSVYAYGAGIAHSVYATAGNYDQKLLRTTSSGTIDYELEMVGANDGYAVFVVAW